MSKIIGFDLGSKSLGIAISDYSRSIALGMENFYFTNGAYRKAIEYAINIIKKEKINEIVIGLALNMDGSESLSSKRALKFKEKLLEYNHELNIIMIDERLTTSLIKHLMIDANVTKIKQKKIDMNAAVLILDTYLCQLNNYKNNK